MAARDQVELYNAKLHSKPNLKKKKQIFKTIKWMRLITNLRFDFLIIPTSYNFVLRKISIGNMMITND